MKLILRQYLASLRERNELDAMIPDLLSQLGLNVISKPGRGTRQYGVDVAAVGSLNGDVEKVYLLSIKAGDLTRRDWDGDTDQALRPSLNEIIDVYIPTHIPPEHKEKPIVICLCFGGVIKETVRPSVSLFTEQNTTEKLSFEEWNGDKLADLILSGFLKEELLPEAAHSQLRKSLALLDEPEASFQHFRTLVYSLTNQSNNKKKLFVLRQLNICLWVLFSWARDIDNLESVYLSSELVLLFSWDIGKEFAEKDTKLSRSVFETLDSTLRAHLLIASTFVDRKILPHTAKKHCISNAVKPSCSLDTNLKLFDILGRTAMTCIWTYWIMRDFKEDDKQASVSLWKTIHKIIDHLKSLINNNPILALPIKDSQVIDISLAVFALLLDQRNRDFLSSWLSEMIFRADFSFSVKGKYPCTLKSYVALLEHPDKEKDGYFEEVTCSSVLFPMISLVAVLIGDNDLYTRVMELKEKHLPHCTFQFWFPCDESEEHFYKNSDMHGATFYSMNLEGSPQDLIGDVFSECEKSNECMELSAVRKNIWPLIFVACRHYRLPIPIHFFQGFKASYLDSNKNMT